MKKFLKRLSVFAAVLIISAAMSITVSAQSANKDVTVLFTHDLHSHFLPSVDENGNEYGGYARLMTVISQQKEKYPNAILVDGGDFAMGSLFQTAYSTHALELRMMGAMGYDVTTFGNHEFDYLPSGLAHMLNIAKSSGDPVPQIVMSNYLPPLEGEENYSSDADMMWFALEHYGVKGYTVIERGGVYYVVFGIFGYDADDCAPNSGMVMEDPVAVSQAVVDEAVAYCVDTYGTEPVVICLSHSGTSDGQGEDYELAKAVNGIDVIVSGHTHTKLTEPIVVNDTYIVSADEYGKNLGVLNFELSEDGKVLLKDYQLIPVNAETKEDATIAALVEKYKNDVETNYLSKYGMGYDEVLVHNPYQFEDVATIGATQHETAVCNIFSDAYKWAVEQATGETVDMAVTARGVVRESLPTGDITVSDVFNAASLGVGTEGELVSVYLTGKELKTAVEIDASVQPLMNAAQLYCSGVEYSFNTNRMLFNKVDYAMLRRDDGTLEEIEDDKLYNVVTGMYCGEMLGGVKETSFGLLSIEPKDKNGNLIDMENLSDYVVKDENGNPVKEWYAISSYLKEMGGEMDSRYADVDGRKIVYSSLNPADLLRNANKFTYLLIGIFVALILLAVFIIRFIYTRKKRKNKR
ncbi:MAG: bifunctional metallophosphatase/5'-nucleotidase [Oscillospiraceae bacterium]|nr:bifunctional metallophosphatase/5'-nucleotidase [Oscillospiraceae bacterium]